MTPSRELRAGTGLGHGPLLALGRGWACNVCAGMCRCVLACVVSLTLKAGGGR